MFFLWDLSSGTPPMKDQLYKSIERTKGNTKYDNKSVVAKNI